MSNAKKRRHSNLIQKIYRFIDPYILFLCFENIITDRARAISSAAGGQLTNENALRTATKLYEI